MMLRFAGRRSAIILPVALPLFTFLRVWLGWYAWLPNRNAQTFGHACMFFHDRWNEWSMMSSFSLRFIEIVIPFCFRFFMMSLFPVVSCFCVQRECPCRWLGPNILQMYPSGRYFDVRSCHRVASPTSLDIYLVYVIREKNCWILWSTFRISWLDMEAPMIFHPK